jgi:hypothetical protein
MSLALAPRRTKTHGALSRRAASARRQSAWRARRRAFQACYVVTVDGAVLDMLERLGWMQGRPVTDKRAVSDAIGELLADAARR